MKRTTSEHGTFALRPLPWLLACALVLCLGTALEAPSVQAQEHPSGQSAGEQGSEAATESHQAGGEEGAEFKQSASVKKVAEFTGLTLSQTYWLSVVINFAVIAAALAWVLKKRLPGMFRGRTASIQKAMEDARRTSEEANRRLGEIESRLARLDVEIGEMRSAAEKEAAAEEARIQAAAAEDARKIVAAAEQEILAAAKSARRELTAHAAGLAVSLAKKQIQVDSNTDQALVRGFTQQLAGDGGQKKDRR